VSATPKSLLRRLRGARGAALLFSGGRALIIVGAVGAAVWCGALARADTTPSPTTPTTTTDAPPPDPYQAPAKTTKQQTAPQHHAAVTHPAPVARLRSYRPVPVAPSPSVVRTTRVTVKPWRHAKPKPVPKHRVRPAPAKQKPISLAPFADLAAAIRAPLPVNVNDERQFPLPAGIALVVLAVGGTALVLLSLRVLRTGARVR
jgi:cytoskeletal protein RodZ